MLHWGLVSKKTKTMNTYYYIDKNGQQAGPITGDLLTQNGVTGSTSVWCEGMSSWQKASEVSELKHLFASIPPPPPGSNSQSIPPVNPTREQCPDTYLVWAILSTILCCWPLGIPAIVHASKVEKLWNQGDKTGAREKSEQAKMWCLIALGGGVLAGIIGFFLALLGSL